MTVDQIIKAFLDGGITLGMLALFAWMIIKLPAMMREAISLATAPTTEAMRALATNIEKMQTELERLSVLVYLSQGRAAANANANANANGNEPPGAASLRTLLRATGLSAPLKEEVPQ
ncbi:MAG: hypothetical protein AB7K09_17950 [Planctomycetota bacterium]